MHASRTRLLFALFLLTSFILPTPTRAQQVGSNLPPSPLPAIEAPAGEPQTGDSRVGVVATLACGLYGRAWRQNPGVPNVGIIAGAISTCLLAFIDAIVDRSEGSDD